MGRSALLLGFVTLLTGFVQLGKRDAFEYTKLLEWVVIAWFLGLAVISGYIEMHDSWIRYILIPSSVLISFKVGCTAHCMKSVLSTFD